QYDLAEELERRLNFAEMEKAAADRRSAARALHQQADRIRFLYGVGHFAPEALRGLEASCRALWENRARVVERLCPSGGGALEPAVRDDLLDLAIFWADLQVQLAPRTGQEKARRQARQVLGEAATLFGPSRVLDEEHKFHGGSAPPHAAAPVETEKRTAWEH